MNEFQNELLLYLTNDIKNGSITLIDNNSLYFNQIKKMFPIGFNRIAWSKTTHNERKVINKNDIKNEVQSFITNFLDENNLEKNVKVVFFGDAIDFAFQLQLEFFYKLIDPFLTIPQHSYLLNIEAKWCFNYTFEDELFIGKS